MRPRNNRQNRVLELGVVLLIIEILNIGYDAIPPVTLVTIVSQTLLYVGLIDTPWDKTDACISARKVWELKDYKPLLLSTVEHADDMHLYYNMISFLVKGRTLEYQYGSANFAILLVLLASITSALYVALAVSASRLLFNRSIMNSCAIGFSGVIFALKLITTLENPVGHRFVQGLGLRVPTRFAAWAELIAIHILVPNASFLGHLAGILAGLLYMKTFLGTMIDHLLYNITGVRVIHRSSSFGRSSRGRSGFSRQESYFFPNYRGSSFFRTGYD